MYSVVVTFCSKMHYNEERITMTKKKYSSVSEFYPYYLQEHKNKTNRRLHFVGTLLLLLVAAFMVITQNWILVFALPVLGYGFAWFGHFVIEKNRPATFTYPIYSLICDFKMFVDILRGRL